MNQLVVGSSLVAFIRVNILFYFYLHCRMVQDFSSM